MLGILLINWTTWQFGESWTTKLLVGKFTDSSTVTFINIAAAAARTEWRSSAYDHYNVTLQRELSPAGVPQSLSFVFTCKFRPSVQPFKGS